MIPECGSRAHCGGWLGVRPTPRTPGASVFRGLCPGCPRPQVSPSESSEVDTRPGPGGPTGGGCDQSFGLLAEDPSCGHSGPWTVLNLQWSWGKEKAVKFTVSRGVTASRRPLCRCGRLCGPAGSRHRLFFMLSAQDPRAVVP